MLWLLALLGTILRRAQGLFALVAIAAGVWLLFGTGWALVVVGVLVLLDAVVSPPRPRRTTVQPGDEP